MASAVVEYIQEALDRNEAPHLVRVCRATGCSLKDGQEALAQVIAQETDVQSVQVVVSTEIDPETNAIAGKTISLIRGEPDDATDLYAVYRSAALSTRDVDDALKNIMWFPRLDEGLGSNGTYGAIASDITCDEALGSRNLVMVAAESASVFSNFKAINTTKTTTPFFQRQSSSSSSKPPPKKQTPSFFGTTSAKTESKQQAAPPSKNKANVVDDSDEDVSDDDDETPKFVKKSTHHKRLRVCDDSDDDDEAEFFPTPKPSHPVKKDDKPVNCPPHPTTAPTTSAGEDRPTPPALPRSQPVAVEKEEATAHRPQKRQKAVTKTHINEDGYMVTETIYEDVEGDEHPTSQTKAASSSGKLPAPPPKKKRVLKGSGTAKQSNLMDFFGKKSV
ncbi:hypothetical protein H310_00434 [Aphanomyces invadans]|uniref:DNA polymerase delta subunit 3 n=1 Tax=Aphanomyces invadans TaxID=157072 RepID=A0A024UVR3_9STRA|nr:hypothetical protein H310_00434 [Aphanomyces invadans]ETW10045.1 hypothetical protein H310_00434 [Aphanomyces invadans]|eukprot:XP_008861456.1 hypothetical protein H310_00434 [Aphanomyces invadans]